MRKAIDFAWQALELWSARQVRVALVATVIIGVLIGVATVLIPNPIFARDIPPVWWNYPVWILTSVVSGMLVATYIRPAKPDDQPATGVGAAGHPEGDEPKDRQGKLGMVGGFLAWFAVGCPVCNKLALLAFGYSGAITYFAPIQPLLGIGALLITGIALVWRLKGQIVCKIPKATRKFQSLEIEPEKTRT